MTQVHRHIIMTTWHECAETEALAERGGFRHVREVTPVFLARLFMLTADIIAGIRTAHGHHSAWAEYRGGR